LFSAVGSTKGTRGLSKRHRDRSEATLSCGIGYPVFAFSDSGSLQGMVYVKLSDLWGSGSCFATLTAINAHHQRRTEPLSRARLVHAMLGGFSTLRRSRVRLRAKASPWASYEPPLLARILDVQSVLHQAHLERLAGHGQGVTG
jgi:hypothetical protein